MNARARHITSALIIMMGAAAAAPAAEANQPPVIQYAPPATVRADDLYLYAEVYGSDPDGDPVTVTIDPGDGPSSQPIAMGAIVPPRPGTTFGAYVEYDYRYAGALYPETVVATIAACDPSGACATYAFNVEARLSVYEIWTVPDAQVLCTTPGDPITFDLMARPYYSDAYVHTLPSFGRLTATVPDPIFGAFPLPGFVTSDQYGFVYPDGAQVTWDPAQEVGTASFDWQALGDEGGSGSVGTVTVVSHEGPLNQTPDRSVCAGDTVELSGSTSEAIGATWRVNGEAISGDSFVAPAPPAGQSSLTLAVQLEQTDACGQVDTSSVSNVNVRAFNTAPVAGVTVPTPLVAEGTAGVLLDGGASYDPEGDALVYTWTQIAGPAVALEGASGPTPTFTAPLLAGSTPQLLAFQLDVVDVPGAGACGEPLASAPAFATVTVSNTNAAPAVSGVTASPGTTVVEGDTVTLTAGATDPDGDPLSFSWSCTGGAAVSGTGAEVTVTAPAVAPGGLAVECTVTVDDGQGGAASASITLTIEDAGAPPPCDAVAATPRLWPPNHRMRGVPLEHPAGRVRATSVRSDEPSDGLGDGDTAIDALIDADGTVSLRAERGASGNGRVYTVSYTVSGGGEVVCTGALRVGVPHDFMAAAIDDGPFFDATAP